jgi:FkbM family methyltransferase
MQASFWRQANDVSCRALPYRLCRRLRAVLRRWLVEGGHFMDDPRVVNAWWGGWDALHYLRLVRWRDEGYTPQVVYDIGAHVGMWADMCQHVLEPRQCVLFEPQSKFHHLAMARRPPGTANWRILPYALGEREASADLYCTRNQAASSLLRPLETGGASDSPTATAGLEPVRVMALDDLVDKETLPLPDLVKIDVQGFEAQVWSGGAKVFRHAQRAIVEVSLHTLYQNQKLIGDVLPLFTRSGFAVDDISEAYSAWPDLRLWQVDLWLRRIS